MRKVLVAALVAFLMIITIVPLTDSSDAANTVSFDGYVKINGDLISNPDIKISIYYRSGTDSSGNYTYDLKTSTGVVYGYFLVSNLPQLSASWYYFNVDINGYEITGVSPYLNGEPTDLGAGSFHIWCYQFNSLPSPSGNVYRISNSDAQSININSSSGTISGRITANNEAGTGVNGARVNIIDTSKDTIVRTALSSNGGYYTISNCPTGNYLLEVDISGYEKLTDHISVTRGTITSNYVLSENPGNWFGMDLPHALMAICSIVGGVIVVFAVYYRVNIKKIKSKLIYDDEKND